MPISVMQSDVERLQPSQNCQADAPGGNSADLHRFEIVRTRQRSLLDRERAAMIASDELVANTGVGVSRRIRASYPCGSSRHGGM